MSDIHIQHPHTLGLVQARTVAFKWAEDAEEQFDMACTYDEGKNSDLVHFKRSGVNGTLRVTQDEFELKATLGFLLGAFKGKIEGEIVKNLEAQLAKKPAAKKTVAKKKAA